MEKDIKWDTKNWDGSASFYCCNEKCYWTKWTALFHSDQNWEAIFDFNVIEIRLNSIEVIISKIRLYSEIRDLENWWKECEEELNEFSKNHSILSLEYTTTIKGNDIKSLFELNTKSLELKRKFEASNIFVSYLKHKELNWIKSESNANSLISRVVNEISIEKEFTKELLDKLVIELNKKIQEK